VKLVVNHPTDVHSVSMQQVRDVTGRDVFWTVPFDKTIIRSGQLGTPVVMLKPGSKSARSIVDLAYTISGGQRERRFFRRGSFAPERVTDIKTAMVNLPQGGHE
jgi:hypothetical protein